MSVHTTIEAIFYVEHGMSCESDKKNIGAGLFEFRIGRVVCQQSNSGTSKS